MRLSCYWQWISSKHCQSSLRIHSAIASWIHSYFDNVMTKFMIYNRTHAWKTDVTFSSNQKQGQNQSWLVCTRFAALRASYVCICFEFFSWLAKVVALVWVLQHQLSCPYIKPLFGIVLVNRHAPLLICSSGMNMIWSVYQLLRVANHKEPCKRSRLSLLHSVALRLPNLRFFERIK